MDSAVAQKVAGFFKDYPSRTFQKGHIIIQASVAPKGVLYITEGAVDQYDISDSGTKVVINSFKPGAFFPMSWAINNTPNQYFYEANSKVIALLAPQQDTVAFLHANPDVTFDLLSRVYRGTDGMLRRLAHFMGGNARSRLLFELTILAKRFGVPTAKGLRINFTESDIAQRSGMARETVSRLLGEFKAQHLITTSSRTIVVPNVEVLEAVLGDRL